MKDKVSQLIAQLESNNVQHAVRYEPNYKWITDREIERCRAAHRPAHMTVTTAHHMLKFSYGLYQIMGGVLYELNMESNLFDFVRDAELQDIMFRGYCASRKINFTFEELAESRKKRETFARLYNGPGNILNYVAKMEQQIQRMI
jgi:hypothetical protein